MTTIRPATPADLGAIIAIAAATGQDEDFENDYPGYIDHLMAAGTLVVAQAGDAVAGFGGTMRLGSGADAVIMLTDLFVDPAAHGRGYGRAILTVLWGDEARKMTFASLHASALPLYTSFGVSAWWPLLYLRGESARLAPPRGWSVTATTPELAAELDLAWTGADRIGDYRLWAARPGGAAIIVGHEGRPMAAGATGGPRGEFGITHLALAPSAEGTEAASAVQAAASWPRPPAPAVATGTGTAVICLPGPHPAVRPLLAAGWRVTGLDLHMASSPDLLDPLRAVPNPSLA